MLLVADGQMIFHLPNFYSKTLFPDMRRCSSNHGIEGILRCFWRYTIISPVIRSGQYREFLFIFEENILYYYSFNCLKMCCNFYNSWVFLNWLHSVVSKFLERYIRWRSIAQRAKISRFIGKLSQKSKIFANSLAMSTPNRHTRHIIFYI